MTPNDLREPYLLREPFAEFGNCRRPFVSRAAMRGRIVPELPRATSRSHALALLRELNSRMEARARAELS